MTKPTRHVWPLTLLALLSFVLCLHRLPQLSLRGDEAATVFAARAPWGELWRTLTGPFPHQPLYYVLLHGWMRLAGDGELAVRMISLASGVLMVPLMYALGRRLFPGEGIKAAGARGVWGDVGLWAAALAAINPMLIWDAQDNRMYALLALFNLASFYLSLAILRGCGGWRAWAGYVLAATLALYTHYLAFFILFAQNVVWMALFWRVPQRWRRLGRWAAAQATVALLFAPWLWHALAMATGFSTDFLYLPGWREMFRRALVSFSLGRSVSQGVGAILGWGFLVTVLLDLRPSPHPPTPSPLPHLGEERGRVSHLPSPALGRETRDNPPFPSPTAEGGAEMASHLPSPVIGRGGGGEGQAQSLLILLLYLLVPLGCIVIFSISRFSIYDENYIAISLPPYIVLLARGISNLSGRGVRRGVAILGLVWVLLASGYSLRNYYYVPQHMKGALNWRSYVARLLECAQPGDVLIQNYPDPGLSYHLRERMPRALLPRAHPVDAPGTEADLRQTLETYARIWAQPVRYEGWDAEGLVETWLDRHAFKVAEEQFDHVRLSLYLPRRTFQSMLVPSDVLLGERIRLLGYALERGAERERRRLSDPPVLRAQGPWRRGEQLTLTLFWQSQSPIPEGYTVFVHLYDGTMRLWTQQDNLPDRGTYPTFIWQPGEVVVDRYLLTLPVQMPVGSYRLGVGMYYTADGTRLGVRQGGKIVADGIAWLELMQVTP